MVDLDSYQYLEGLLLIFLFASLIVIRLKYNANYFYNKGLEAYNECRFKEAQSFLKKALNRKGTYHQARNILCLCYFKMNDYIAAQNCLEKIIKLEPNNFEAIYNLALALQAKGNYEEAKKLYEMALKINSKDYDSYYNLGTIAFNEKEYQKAKEYFEKANAINPSVSNSRFYIIKCQDELCEFNGNKSEEEIIECYLKLEGRENLSDDYYLSLATAYAKRGDIENAEKYALKATEANPDDARSYRLLSVIYILKKDAINADNNISIAIQLDANNKEGYNLIRYSKLINIKL